MNANFAAIAYLISGVLFIQALRGLSSPETSRRGNMLGMAGMTIAVGVTLLTLWGRHELDPVTVGMILGGVAIGGAVGAVTARRIAMTAMPQLVAAFHSLVGMAACLVAVAAVYTPAAYGIALADGSVRLESLIELSIGVAIGAVTFTGSLIAFAKLNGNMSGASILLPARHLLNIALASGIVTLIVLLTLSGGEAKWAFWGVFGLALVIGITLIITGALVGSSGAILSYIMCKGMNRSFISVILGGFGGEVAAAGKAETRPVKQGSAEDAAFIMKNASKVIIVPGYGMAVAQAQHALREMADKLKEEGVEVKYAIHPVAGRMPGHMNVLLAEANVPYDEVFELEDINSEFATADVAFVIGANDVTNPAAKTDKTSPIYGMPILDVEKARTVLFVKRGMGSGYAGVENELFFRDNTMMLFADAKKMVEGIVKAL